MGPVIGWVRSLARPLGMLLVAALAVASTTVGLALVAAPARAEGTPDLTVGVELPDYSLYGDETLVRLRVTNPQGSGAVGYNASIRVVLPAGVGYVPGSATVGAPTVRADAPSPGRTTLVWTNVADIQVGAQLAPTFRVRPAVEPADDALLPGAVLAVEATVVVSAEPRRVPAFDGGGLPVAGSFTGSGTGTATTPVVALAVEKELPEAESELLRGVHQQRTVYTLTLTNNDLNPTTGVRVVDLLPAGLEFLGCGDADNTTAAATNPGSREEYPGSGTLARERLADDCPEPASVRTLETDPDGGGPLPSAVVTEVVWTGIDLAPGASVRIRYAAGVALRENTLAFPGGAPAPADGGQAANLDNNSGPETRDEQELTNVVTAAGTYAGALAPGATNPVASRDTLTVQGEDVALVKTVSSPQFAQNGVVTYTLDVAVSEYRAARDVVVVDTLPDGLCPLGPANYGGDAECAPTADRPSRPYDQVVANADGTFTIRWTLGALGADGSERITFPARQKRFGQGGRPTVAGDVYTNRVGLSARTDPIGALPDAYPGDVGVVDVSEAAQETVQPELRKTVGRAGPAGTVLDCATTRYATSPPVLQLGDRVCYRLRVDFPATVDTRGAVVTDFLPPGVTFEAGSVRPTAASTAPVAGFTAEEDRLTWRLGADRGGALYVDPGAVFEVVLSGRITADPTGSAEFDLVDNLMKFTSVNTAGEATSLRDSVAFTLAAPVLGLVKGVRDVAGAPAAGNPPDTDGAAAVAGDIVTFRVDVTNTGPVEAYDTEVRDVLPDQLRCADVTAISDGGTCVGTAEPDEIRWTGLPVIQPDATRTVTVSVRVPIGTAAADRLVDRAGVRSYAGEQNVAGLPRTTFVPADNIDPTATPTPGTPAARDDADVVVPSVEVGKDATTDRTDPGNGTGDATIGETVDYRLTATVPAGTSVYGFRLTDPVDPRATLTGPPTATLDGAPLPAGATVGVSGTEVVLTLPATYTNPAGSGPDVIVVTYSATVADTDANRRPGTLPNTVSAGWDGPTGQPLGGPSATVGTPLVEPDLTVAATTGLSGSVAPGQTVPYRVTVGNRAGGGVSTAHDVRVVDTLPAGLTYVPGSASAGGEYDPATRTLTWTVPAIAPGTDVPLTYRATVDTGARPGARLDSRIEATATSLPGTVTGERTYQVDTRLTVLVEDVGFSKAIDATRLTVGQSGVVTLRTTIRAGLAVPDATVLDTLPNGLELVGFLDAGCASGSTGCSPDVVVQPLPPVGGTEGRTRLGWSLGDVEPATADRVVTIRYTTRVAREYAEGARPGDADSSGTVSAGDALTNVARLWWNETDGTNPTAVPADPAAVLQRSTTDQAATVTVVEPRLAVAKAASAATAVPGDTVTYTVTVSAAAGPDRSPAYAVTVLDQLPTGLVPVEGSISAGGSYDPATRRITWTVPGPVQPGASVQLGYGARIVPAEAGAAALVNTASVPAYAGLPGGAGATGRAYVGPSAEHRLTPDYPGLTTAKTVAGGGESAPAYLGTPFGWVVTVRNTAAAATARTVTLTDTLPRGWRYEAGSARFTAPGRPGAAITPAVAAGPSGDVLTFTGLGDLGPGQELTVTLAATPTADALATGTGADNPHVNTARAAATDASGATGNADGPYGGDPDPASAVIEAADLRLAVAGGPLVPGAAGTLTLTLDNAGPSAAVGPLTVVTVLPAGVTYVSTGGAGWTCSAADRRVTCQREAGLPAGAGTAVVLTVAVDPGLTGEVAVTATASSPTYDPSPAAAELTVALAPRADLAVGLTGAETVVPGTQTRYTIGVGNLGPSRADTPRVVGTLPAGVTPVAAEGPGWTCTVDGQQVTCTWSGPLAPGADTGPVTVTADVAPGATGPLTASARVTTATPDPVPANDTATVTAATTARPDRYVTVDSVGEVTAGADARYVITAGNLGPSDERGPVTVTATLPATLTPRSAAGSGWDCTLSGRELTCTRGGLAAGATAPPIELVAGVDPELTGDVLLTVTVTGTGDDPVPGNDSDTDSSAAQVRADLGITKTHEGDLVAGGTGTYTLQVRNDGPSAAPAPLVVTDRVPAGMRAVSATGAGWTCTVEDDTVTCRSAAGLAPGARSGAIALAVAVGAGVGPATLVNGASVAGPVDDPDPTDNAATDPTAVRAEADLALTKRHAGPVVAGGTVDFTLAVRNAGPSDAAGPVTLTDTLPAGLVPGTVAGAGWDCTTTGLVVSCRRAAGLAAGESAELTLTASVPAGQPAGTLRNAAAVTGPTPDPQPADDAATDDVEVAVRADLGIGKSHSGPVLAGRTVDYAVDVRNDGPSDAAGVAVTDTLPAGLTFVATQGPAWACAAAGQEVTCTLDGTLPAGASAPPLTLTALVGADVPAGTLVNAVTVGAATPDPDPADDTATDPTRVDVAADLAVTKTRQGPLQVGQQTTYALQVRNNGPSTSPGPVRVTDTLPAGLRYVSAEGTGWTCAADGREVTCRLPDGLPAGTDAAAVTLVVDVLPAAYPEVTNSARVDGPTLDPVGGNDTAADTAPVGALADLRLVKAARGEFLVGATGEYVLAVTNLGPTADPGPVTVTDVLPAGLTFASAAGAGWECTADGQRVTCTAAGGLAADAGTEVTLRVAIGPEAAPGVTNTATVAGGGTDPDGANDVAAVETVVVPRADLTVAKTLRGRLVAGQDAAYRIEVRNDGPSAATGVVVTDTLPAGLAGGRGAGDGWTCRTGGRVVTCELDGTLAAGAARSLTVTARVVAAAGVELANRAAVRAEEVDPAPAGNAATADGTVEPGPSGGPSPTAPPGSPGAPGPTGPPGPADPSPPGAGGLPSTGADVTGILLAAVFLLAVGAVLAVAARTRRRPLDDR